MSFEQFTVRNFYDECFHEVCSNILFVFVCVYYAVASGVFSCLVLIEIYRTNDNIIIAHIYRRGMDAYLIALEKNPNVVYSHIQTYLCILQLQCVYDSD